MGANKPESPVAIIFYRVESITLTAVEYYPDGSTAAFYARDLIITNERGYQTIKLFANTAQALEIALPAKETPA